MPSRRTLLGRIGTVGLLGASLSGLAGGSAAGVTDSTRSAGSAATYDAGRIADGDTVVTAAVDPAVVSTVGLPEPWSTRLSAATERADVSLADVDAVAGSVALSGSSVEGAVVARGSFDPDRLAAAVEGRGRWSTARTRRTAGVTRRFRGRGEPYAVAVNETELVVGYAPDVDRAADHVDAAVRRTRDGSATGKRSTTGQRSSTGQRSATGYGSLPSLLSGDVTVYANLGESGRNRLRSALSGAPDSLEATVEAAGSIGVALGVDGGGDGGTDLRYAATLDPTRLTRDRLRRLSGGVDSEGALDDATVGFRGRTVVVDATPTREDLFSLHDDLYSDPEGPSSVDDDAIEPEFGR
ncbi:hypothetical protein [Halorubrum cibi]|uniref:Uncharacterized protein n=1 Tax=Halorubrum cibi TaxID=413815 RepID=A0A521EFZ5_9EURY|nr:hypothetical protein [Halorubrum cibi]SMO82834.1 hypothetical protein SAMN06264867_110137 [Halorubrum cibi]